VRLGRSPVGQFTGRFVNWFTLHRTLLSQDGFMEGGYMDEPTKLVPDWLTVDLLIIVLGLAVILTGIWMV
jgi:hypothetical protein